MDAGGGIASSGPPATAGVERVQTAIALGGNIQGVPRRPDKGQTGFGMAAIEARPA